MITVRNVKLQINSQNCHYSTKKLRVPPSWPSSDFY